MMLSIKNIAIDSNKNEANLGFISANWRTSLLFESGITLIFAMSIKSYVKTSLQLQLFLGREIERVVASLCCNLF